MNEPARWAIWVASAIGPLLAVYGLFELAGWHGGAASWVFLAIALPLTVLVNRAIYGRRRP